MLIKTVLLTIPKNDQQLSNVFFKCLVNKCVQTRDTVHVLGQRMEHNVRPQLQRALKHSRAA